jgi:hypothetical protein
MRQVPKFCLVILDMFLEHFWILKIIKTKKSSKMSMKMLMTRAILCVLQVKFQTSFLSFAAMRKCIQRKNERSLLAGTLKHVRQ